MDSWGILGFVHVLGALVLGLAGSETLLVCSQLFGGLFEIVLAVWLYEVRS
jgi:hypothetical protein